MVRVFGLWHRLVAITKSIFHMGIEIAVDTEGNCCVISVVEINNAVSRRTLNPLLVDISAQFEMIQLA